MKKIAIVTGGSRGIGLGITEQLQQDGYAVAVVAQSPASQAAELADRLAAAGGIYLQGSIADGADRERCVAQVVRQYGRIDVLVNNAGVAPQQRADLLEMTEDSFDRLLSINLAGTMFFTQLVAKQMISQPMSGKSRGVIVNISSISSTVSSVSRGEYCVSKAGISMLTTLYADRLAAEAIPVYEVRPGIIATDMTAAVQEKYDALFAGGLCPIARWGTPQDVADAVSVLCSGKLSYTTGEVLHVDGGFHIQRL